MITLDRLPSKHHFRADHVQAVWDTIEQTIEPAEIDAAIAHAADRIHMTRTRLMQSGALPADADIRMAWSGGKDSLALEIVCAAAGVSKGMCGLSGPNLEFPAFLGWLNVYRPRDVMPVWTPDLDWSWLQSNQHRLFPRDSAGTRWWMSKCTWGPQEEYAKAYGPFLYVMGRRTADGNMCGRDGVTSGRAGCPVFNPLYDWSHELTLAVVKTKWLPGRELPPVYLTPDGWVDSGAPWPGRRYDSDAAGWAYTYRKEPAILQVAAAYDLRGARAFMETINDRAV